MSIPVILIPGIKGTTLINSNTLNHDTIYSGVQSKYETIFDLELELNPDFEVSQRAIIKSSDVEDLAYREIVSVLKRKANSQTYFFGYDWRKSCKENGKKLKKYVDYLKEKLRVDKFNFVTHSMGGMIMSCYLKELYGNYDVVNKAVLTVCPFRGSINSLTALLVGEGGIKFPLFNSNDEFRKLARTFNAVYELTPYYKGAITFDNGEEFDLYNPTHWQSNIKSEMFERRLQELKKFRIDDEVMLDFKDLPEIERKKFIFISGVGEKTKNKVKVVRDNGRVKNFFNLEYSTGDGDGTVPKESSTFYKGSILTLTVKSKWYDKATHGFILNDGRVQTVIKRFFNSQSDGEWYSDIAKTVKCVSPKSVKIIY